MNSRRLGILALRTAVFVIVAVVLAALNGWGGYATLAVALTTTALAIQLAGVLWLRRREHAAPTTDEHDTETPHSTETSP